MDNDWQFFSETVGLKDESEEEILEATKYLILWKRFFLNSYKFQFGDVELGEGLNSDQLILKPGTSDNFFKQIPTLTIKFMLKVKKDGK